MQAYTYEKRARERTRKTAAAPDPLVLADAAAIAVLAAAPLPLVLAEAAAAVVLAAAPPPLVL